METLSDVVLQADKSAFKAKKIGGPLPGNKAGMKNGMRPGGLRENMALETLDFNKKILHASWHPRENTIAVSNRCASFSCLRTQYHFLSDCRYEQPLLVQRRMSCPSSSSHPAPLPLPFHPTSPSRIMTHDANTDGA